MFCQFCGAQIADNLQFCPNCGRSQAPGAGPPPPNPQPAAAFTPPASVRVEAGRWISDGWHIVQADLGMMALVTIIVMAVSNAVPVVLAGPLSAGFYIYIASRMLYGRAEVGDVFKGFNYFVPTLVTSLLIAVFSFFGLLLCILPVFVVAALFMFPYLFIVDKKMDFWPAMMASKDVASKDWFGFTLFIILLSLLQIVGFLCLLVGLLVTIPIMHAAIAVAYRDVVGFEPNTQF